MGLVRLSSTLTNRAQVYADPMASPITVTGYADEIILPGSGHSGGNYCSSGVSTLAKCNLYAYRQVQVTASNAPYPMETFYAIEMTVPGGGTAFCSGDSGGPVYFYPQGLSTPRVTAAGIISGILPFSGGSSCGGTGYISVVAVAVNEVPGLQIRYVP
ncbi:trypsin-like serine protease [Beutenbergia cavernae]|uniref:trypsin-like serine protease n=1 Tax=Beutenbergia cavernae TaxID=84757 RepID=UPI0016511D23